MSYDIYLSYSGRKTFITCPKQYYFRYIEKDKTPLDPKKVMFGSIIGKVFEWFYERRLWQHPDMNQKLLECALEATELVFLQENYRKNTDYSYETGLQDDLKKYVPLGVEIIKKNALLTANSQAELDLTVVYSPPNSDITLKMAGRADFVHYKSPDDVWIMDGKAYKQREKYVDSDQLLWYATQHYIKYRVAPSRLGFIYWLFPDNPVSYIDYDSDSMRNLIKDTFDISRRILDKDFSPKPSGECHRCIFKHKCDDGQKYVARRKVETGGRIENSIFDLEDVTSINGGQNG
jgi:PD-(D/E)XK nuclease superfamily